MLEQSLEVLKKIEEHGKKAYIVGGFVRDYILNIKSYDVDICTDAMPREVKEIFNDALLPSEKYGSATVFYKKIRYEITTFRIDREYINNRVPSDVEYTTDLLTDLKRRDFTMNTLCIDSSGNVIDLLNAMDDVKNKIIRSVGDPNHIIQEDALRILRAIRFATILEFNINDDLDQAIINNKTLVANLSFFRKKDELFKIFSSKNAKRGIELLKKYDLSNELSINLDKNIVVTKDIMGIWVQLEPSDGYQFTKTEKHALNTLKYLINKENITKEDVYTHGEYLCLVAAEILNINSENVVIMNDELQIHNIADINISSLEVLNLVKDKSKVKGIMLDLEKKILNNELINNKKDITEYLLKKYINDIM
ncbi:MAG TPA: hypothetical protein PKY25_01420 [Bacilli bacterium]|nr:hypothetical protein [Bacilli bacterium]